MAQIDLCFVWHMHQPFYKDLVTGEYKLPWTRLHGLKDYYGMVEILAAFPSIHQTFNLVPSMVAQLDEYAAGAAEDPFLRLALKPAEELTDADQAFLLRYFFQANLSRMVYRYPRYGELYELSLKAGRFFGAQEFRDLQILSQLAWFDEIFLAADPEIRDLVAKGRHYSLADQKLMGRKQLEILGHVVPVYQKFAATGQIEVSTTPYYHPLRPLLCDSDNVRRLTALRNAVGRRVILFSGVDDLVLESALLGAEGWVSGLVNAFPDENRVLWQLAQQGRWAEARELYQWYTPLLHLDTKIKLVQYIKLCMAEVGLG
ncbi:MAG: dihydrodipicolinate synthase family protein, partial [Acidobacteriota bacterium]